MHVNMLPHSTIQRKTVVTLIVKMYFILMGVQNDGPRRLLKMLEHPENVSAAGCFI